MMVHTYYECLSGGISSYIFKAQVSYLFGVGTSSFGPLEPASAPCIPQTKGPNKVYSVLVNIEQVIEG